MNYHRYPKKGKVGGGTMRKENVYIPLISSLRIALFGQIFSVQAAIDTRNAIENQTTLSSSIETNSTFGKFGSLELASQTDIHSSANANRNIRIQTVSSQENNARIFIGTSRFSYQRNIRPLDVTAYRLVCFGVLSDHEKPASVGC